MIGARGGGAAGAIAALRCVAGVWRDCALAGGAPQACDLHAALLRVALPLVPALPIPPAAEHLRHAVELIARVAELCGGWLGAGAGAAGAGGQQWRGGEAGSEARLSGLLADVLASGSTRRVPLRRTLLAHLLHYARALLAVHTQPSPHRRQVCAQQS